MWLKDSGGMFTSGKLGGRRGSGARMQENLEEGQKKGDREKDSGKEEGGGGKVRTHPWA